MNKQTPEGSGFVDLPRRKCSKEERRHERVENNKMALTKIEYLCDMCPDREVGNVVGR